MSATEIARCLQSRVPWDVGKRIFTSLDIPKGHGWEKTVERLKTLDPRHDEELANALEQHYICGEKLARFYDVGAKKTKELSNKLAKFPVPKNSFSTAYPQLLHPDSLQDEYQKPHVLAHVYRNDDGVAAVLASSRAIFVREPVNTDDLPEEVADRFNSYDEIVGVKLIKYQAMDTVWIPHDGSLVDVRIDFPKGMNHDQGLAAHEAVRTAFHAFGEDKILSEPVNLFPLIDVIYNDPNEGVVVELAFGTTTASLKHEKMRRAHSDLRKEIYHRGGKQALKTPIEPYRLSVEYSVDLGPVTSLPELGLHGSARMAGSDNPVLYDAVIRKCMGIADYEHVRSRVNKFVVDQKQKK